MSMLGIFDGVCLLCGGTTFEGFSTATSPILYMEMVFQVRSLQRAKRYAMLRAETEKVVSGSYQNELTGRAMYVLAWKCDGSCGNSLYSLSKSRFTKLN